VTLTLRPYQEQALADLYGYFEAHTGNPLVVLPTGAGKSLVIAEWCRLMFDIDPRSRIVILTHVQELVGQNWAELVTMWPDAPAGIYSAGLGRRELHARILFASIQSIHSRAYDLQECDIVMIDEAHLIPRNSETMYRRFLSECKRINPHLKIIGLTATPFRLDSGMLHEGDNAMFDDIAHETPVRQLIDDGFLCPPVTFRQAAQIDTTDVGTRLGEFIASQLEVAAMDPATLAAIADRIVEAGQDRKGWLVFGCTVAHCEALGEALTERGVTVGTIFGDTGKTERAHTIAAFKAGRLRALCNMGVLTTGFNAKHVDLIALARPTKSTGLYVQMVGRGTRLATGKTNCLVLDFGGNIARHGPFDEPYVKKPKKGGGPAPFKECPDCQCACGTATRFCPNCGHEFPPPERLVKVEAEEKPILAPPPAWIDVTDIAYARHEKLGKPPSLKVTYTVGMGVQHSEWICFEHSGYARTKAEVWWQRRAPAPVPRTVADAMERLEEVAAPVSIQLRREGDFFAIARHMFEHERIAA
jgi:DNA repair protein RadD